MNARMLEKQIARLNRIGIALSSEHNLNRLLDMIVREARHFTNADGGSLYIREENVLNFIVAQTSSLEKKNGQSRDFKSLQLPLTKESIGGYVAITGQILNIPDAYLIPSAVEYRLNKGFDRTTGYRTKSMLVVPMRDHDDDIIGVLQLINSLDDDGQVVPFKQEYEMLIHSLASQAAVAIRNARLIEEIRELFRSVVRYSAKAIDARSPHTAGHSGRVAKYCVRIMRAMNQQAEGRFADACYSAQEFEEMRMAGWLHDIGKIGVREAVLEKENKLNDAQMDVVVNRYTSIKALKMKDGEEEKVRLALQGKLDEQAIKKVDDKVEMQLKELSDELDFILKINFPGYLNEEDRQRLKDISRKTFTGIDGKKNNYLSAFEYENLKVIRGNLTEKEYEEIQSHVNKTLMILDKIPFTKDLERIPKFAAAHHEMLNGSGYPLGLHGEEIPLGSCIMAVSDIFDALNASDRPYKKALPLEKSLSILQMEAEEGKLDKDIVALFISERLYEKNRFADDEEDDE